MATSNTLASREGQLVPSVSLRVRRNGEWATVDYRRDLREPQRRGVLAARRVHARPARRRTCRATTSSRRRSRANGIDEIVCVSVNDPFVMERVGEGPGRAERHAAARRQRRVHREDGHAGRQDRPRLRQALVALLDAGARRRDREDVHRAAEAGRPVRGLGRRHDARLHQPERAAARTRWRSSRAKAARTARAPRSCSTDAGIEYAEVPLPQGSAPRRCGAIAKAQTVPQVFINGELIGGRRSWSVLRKAA